MRGFNLIRLRFMSLSSLAAALVPQPTTSYLGLHTVQPPSRRVNGPQKVRMGCGLSASSRQREGDVPEDRLLVVSTKGIGQHIEQIGCESSAIL